MKIKMFIIFAIWNVIVFLIYGIDKYRAVKNRWRISEKALITCALLMGGIGAKVGMEAFRHKTKKPLFKLGVPAAIAVNLVIIYFLAGRI